MKILKIADNAHSALATPDIPLIQTQESSVLALIVLLPILGAILLGSIALFNSTKEQGPSEKVLALLGCAGPFAAALIAFFLFSQQWARPELVMEQQLAPWLVTQHFAIDFAFRFDPLSAIMTVMITFIGSLIHVFSISYMHGDRGFARYFAYLNLFLGAMLLLILSDNIIGMFMGWEGVGVCSFLLIGFWFQDAQKAGAGTKAFIANRVGDFGFILGIILLFYETRHFDYVGMAQSVATIPIGTLAVIGMLLFIGAMGKSAQIPLHVWLPDAMAGPTPVSALIHAATMVTAGVYMVARFHFLYALTPSISNLIVLIGTLTAFVAASIALVQRDIKKVLAYSTVSQLGYMFMAVGAGAYAAGIFHVFTHAFFKAALFLGAGAVIHCLHHEQNMMKMGGLKSKLPVTHLVMGISCLAIAGVPPFAGFFSKDEILWSLFEKGLYLPWGVGLITAGLTAFYMFRLFFLSFYGEYRGTQEVSSEPLLMKVPLLILGLGALGAGFLGLPGTLGLPNWFAHWLAPVVGGHHSGTEHMTVSLALMAVSVVAAVIGIVVAKQKYSQVSQPLPEPEGPLNELLVNKYGFDLLYDKILVQPLRQMGSFAWQIGDRLLIDGAIVAGTWAYRTGALILRTLQFGKLRAYAQYLVLGSFLLICLFYMLHMPGVLTP